MESEEETVNLSFASVLMAPKPFFTHFSIFCVDIQRNLIYYFLEVIFLHKSVLQGNELFSFNQNNLPVSVKDFWAWAMSRLIADGPRGDLAEFIVNTALGIGTTVPKKGWGECDIVYNGVRIEIKCSSLLQAWDREQPSKPVFSIGKTFSCDIGQDGDRYIYVGHDDTEPQRRSEIYVFCLYNHTDRSTANPMILDQWQFYIVPTHQINKIFPNRRTLTMAGLAKLGAEPHSYGEIKSQVDAIIHQYSL